MAKNLVLPIDIHSDDYIRVLYMDEEGAGGAHHCYHVYEKDLDIAMVEPLTVIKFQEGPIRENGVNGCTNEALLAIVEHRLDCFQSGPFPSWFNETALSAVKIAEMVLLARTEERKSRGVEGETKA